MANAYIAMYLDMYRQLFANTLQLSKANVSAQDCVSVRLFWASSAIKIG